MSRQPSIRQRGAQLTYDLISDARVQFHLCDQGKVTAASRQTDSEEGFPETEAQASVEDDFFHIHLNLFDFVNEQFSKKCEESAISAAFQARSNEFAEPKVEDTEVRGVFIPGEDIKYDVELALLRIKQAAREVVVGIDVLQEHAGQKEDYSAHSDVLLLQDHFRTIRQCILWSRSVTEQVRQKDRITQDEEGAVFEVPSLNFRKNYRKDYGFTLHHFQLPLDAESTSAHFHDVRYVCIGDSARRMKDFAIHCIRVLRNGIPPGMTLVDLCPARSPFSMFKSGPVLIVSHQGGEISMTVLLNELFQFLHYARVRKTVKMFKIASCAGIGVRPGTVVVNRVVYSGIFGSDYEEVILGRTRKHPAVLSDSLAQDLIKASENLSLLVPAVEGNSISIANFYEGQGRLDGAFCDYTHMERMRFLQKCMTQYGICSIDLDAMVFAAFTHRVGIEAAIVSVAVIDRFTEDAINQEQAKHVDDWHKRPHRLVGEFIRRDTFQIDPSKDEPEEDTLDAERLLHVRDKYNQDYQHVPPQVLTYMHTQRNLLATANKTYETARTPDVVLPEKFRQFRPMVKEVQSEIFWPTEA